MIIKVSYDSDWVEISDDPPNRRSDSKPLRPEHIKVMYPSQVLKVVEEILNRLDHSSAPNFGVELIKVDEGREITIGEW